MFAYPKLRYRAHPEDPGYTCVRVTDPAEEEALGEGYFDTPGEMRAAAEEDAEPIEPAPTSKKRKA